MVMIIMVASRLLLFAQSTAHVSFVVFSREAFVLYWRLHVKGRTKLLRFLFELRARFVGENKVQAYKCVSIVRKCVNLVEFRVGTAHYFELLVLGVRNSLNLIIFTKTIFASRLVLRNAIPL